MIKNETKRGLAIGAAFSLLFASFAGLPAQAATDVELKMTPATGTSTTVLVTDEIDLVAFPVTADGFTQIANLSYYVEKASTTSVLLVDADYTTSNLVTASSTLQLGASTTDSVVVPTTTGTAAGQQNLLALRLKDATSVSASVVVYVTAFIDANGNGEFDTNDVIKTSRTPVTFTNYAKAAAAFTLTAPFEADVEVTADAALTGFNTTEMDGTLKVQFTHTSTTATTSNSALTGGSSSADVPALLVADSVSATLVYSTSAAVDALGGTAGTKTLGITKRATKGVTVSAVASGNIAQVGAGASDARVNSSWTLHAYAYTGSGAVTTSVKVSALTLKVTVSPALTSTRSITINGVTYTDSAKLPTTSGVVLTQGTDGKAAIAVSTVGWENAQSASFTVTGENFTNTMQVQTKVSSWTITSDDGVYATAAKGGSVALAFSVKDNWDVLSPLTTQRVKLVTSGTGFTTDNQTLALAGGKAATTVTAAPNSISGALVAKATVQTQNAQTGNWVDSGSSVSVNIAVSDSTNSFTVKPVKATYSASISYGVALSYSEEVTVNVAVTGSNVVISSPGLIIYSGTDSASDTLTVRAGSAGVVTFKATSTMAGTYTVSIVAGAATASTQIVVAPALYSAGTAVSYDVSELLVGKSSTVTGTLVDANGNPVATGVTGSIVVAWTGGGLPFNLPTDTDANGEFEFQVLVLSTEVGEAAVSLTYRPNGATVDTKNKTFANAIDLVSSLTPVAGDQKVNAGSFKGYVAVYARGYEGQRLSAKIGKDWVIVDPIVNNQENGSLFRVTDFTGAGVDIAVRIYIDRVLIDTINLTTK